MYVREGVGTMDEVGLLLAAGCWLLAAGCWSRTVQQKRTWYWGVES